MPSVLVGDNTILKQSLMFQHFPVLSGCYAGALLENPDEMAGIIKAGIHGDLRDGIPGIFKKPPSLFNTVARQVLYGTLTDSTLHEFIEIIDRYIGGAGKAQQRKLFFVMF